MSLKAVPWVRESRAGRGRSRASVSSWEVVLGAPCPPAPPPQALLPPPPPPVASAAGTATAHGSAPRRRPSELPAPAWPLELLGRWEVCVWGGTRPQQQPASLRSGPVCLWLPGLLSSAFSPPDCSVCLPPLVSMSPGAWALRASLGWVCPRGSLFLCLWPVFLVFLFSEAVFSMLPSCNSRMQLVPVLRFP